MVKEGKRNKKRDESEALGIEAITPAQMLVKLSELS
jgi:hypothetical protein